MLLKLVDSFGDSGGLKVGDDPLMDLLPIADRLLHGEDYWRDITRTADDVLINDLYLYLGHPTSGPVVSKQILFFKARLQLLKELKLARLVGGLIRTGMRPEDIRILLFAIIGVMGVFREQEKDLVKWPQCAPHWPPFRVELLLF